MKKVAITLLALFTLSIANTAFAHPGRTNKKGQHRCKTNCERWGVEYGEYHQHAKKVKKARRDARKSARK